MNVQAKIRGGWKRVYDPVLLEVCSVPAVSVDYQLTGHRLCEEVGVESPVWEVTCNQQVLNKIKRDQNYAVLPDNYCPYRGAIVRTDGSKGCPRKTMRCKVYRCSLYGECSLNPPLSPVVHCEECLKEGRNNPRDAEQWPK